MERRNTARGLKHYLNNCITPELSEKNQIVTRGCALTIRRRSE